MTIERISYSKIFPIASFINEKIGVDILLNEGESPDEAFAEAKRWVEKFHVNAPTQFTQVANEQPMPIHTIQNRDEAVDMITAINACIRFEGDDGLNTFTTLARMNPEWNEAYRNKLIELQNKT